MERGPCRGDVSGASSGVSAMSPFPAKVVRIPLAASRAPHAIVLDVADKQIVAPVQHNAMRLFELGLGGRTGIAAKAGLHRCPPGSRLFPSGRSTNRTTLASRSAIRHVSLAVKPHLMRRAEQGLLGLPAITGMAPGALARNGRDTLPTTEKTKYAVAAEIGPVQCTVRANQHAIRLVDLGGLDELAITGKALHAGPGQA